MSGLLKICGGALIAAGCAFLIKESSKGGAVSAAIIGLTVIMGTVLTGLFSVISPLKEAMSENGVSDYVNVMFKGLGIGITVKLTSDICSDLGESGIADCVELAGRTEILILCMPILIKILNSVKELLS